MFPAWGYVVLGAAATLWIAEWISRVLGTRSVLGVAGAVLLDPVRYAFWWLGDALRRAVVWLLRNLRVAWDAVCRLVRFLKFREMYRALVDTALFVLTVPIAPAQVLLGFLGARFRHCADTIRETRRFFGRKAVFGVLLLAAAAVLVYVYAVPRALAGSVPRRSAFA